MKKENLASMILGIIGGIAFSLGMVMALMAEWNLFIPGVIAGSIGAVILIAIFPVYWILAGKKMFKITLPLTTSSLIGAVGFAGLVASLVMILTTNNVAQHPGYTIASIAIGLVGIVALVICYPVYKIMSNKKEIAE
ncbi:hypothetical protein SCHIN_v1c07390 [Spiroplasma chinense]|uniref:Uncharacterized protein n=1 Tax=Spiroplasma chinense TaxID=216932 RepID=A0A5B9Y4C9_9MOLU|nr:hypothetical protein [Spiroplasma chinense]QEH61934.1 hypothetical protein SCHIN_v1c07390 [Spiroplasma chinense]